MDWEAEISAYYADIVGYGIKDEYIASIDIDGLRIARTKDLSDKQTGERYLGNVIAICTMTTCETGVEPAVDQLINQINENPLLGDLFKLCGYVELQIHVSSYGGKLPIPNFGISKEQLSFLKTINADIDVSIM